MLLRPPPAAEEFSENILPIAQIGKSLIARIARGPAFRTCIGVFAIIAALRPLGTRGIDLAAVEAGAFLGIAENVVGRADVLEPFFGFLVTGIQIGMMLLGELAIGLLDFFLRGVLAHT